MTATFILSMQLPVPFYSRTTHVNWYQNVSILDFIGDKDDGCAGDNCSYELCKDLVKLPLPPTTNTQLFTDWMLFLLPNQQCQSTDGKSNIFHGLTQQSHPGAWMALLTITVYQSFAIGLLSSCFVIIVRHQNS